MTHIFFFSLPLLFLFIPLFFIFKNVAASLVSEEDSKSDQCQGGREPVKAGYVAICFSLNSTLEIFDKPAEIGFSNQITF